MDISITVCGDEPVESCMHESADVSLICRTDLLSLDSKTQANAAANSATSLARLYLEQGDEFVTRLRGTFAIILYDHRLRVLKAWTDHLGADRLVFTSADGFFVVATDLRLMIPLLTERPAIDPAAVQEYLQYSCIPAPKTIFKGVWRLKPGHQLTSKPTPSATPYWDVRYRDCDEHRTEAAWADDTLNAIRSAVSLNLSGVDKSRVGCFLSGGTDSTSVAGLVSKCTNEPASTFSIGFDDSRYNEIEYARIAARHHNFKHHEYFVTPDDILALIEKAVPAFDEPFGNSSIVPTYYCARLAAENGVTHLLAGDGGDELFGGNSRYVHDQVFQRYGSIPLWMRRLLIEPVVATGGSWTRLGFFDRAARYIRRASINVPDRFHSYSFLSSLPHSEIFDIDFLAAVHGNDPLTPARNHFATAPAGDLLNRWLYLDLKMTITDNDLRKVSVMSRLAGVTPRYPLLDPALVEFTGTIPAELKVRGSDLRYLFKKAMAGILPPEIIKKHKHGFGLPYAVWLGDHGPLRDFTLDILGSDRFRHRGYFRKGLTEWLWSQYENVHRVYYGEILWVLLMLELWHTKQHDPAGETRPDPVVTAQPAY